jgi:hypothetical protein
MLIYLLLFAFLGVLALWLLSHVLAALYWVGWMALWLGLLALIGYVVLSLMKPKLPTLAQFGIKKAVHYRLADTHRPNVYVFRNEPSLKDVAMLHDELHLAKLELQGDVMQVDNNTVVTVLEDSGAGSVKIKLKNTKSKEKIFWAARSSLVTSELPRISS